MWLCNSPSPIFPSWMDMAWRSEIFADAISHQQLYDDASDEIIFQASWSVGMHIWGLSTKLPFNQYRISHYKDKAVTRWTKKNGYYHPLTHRCHHSWKSRNIWCIWSIFTTVITLTMNQGAFWFWPGYNTFCNSFRNLNFLSYPDHKPAWGYTILWKLFTGTPDKISIHPCHNCKYFGHIYWKKYHK